MDSVIQIIHSIKGRGLYGGGVEQKAKVSTRDYVSFKSIDQLNKFEIDMNKLLRNKLVINYKTSKSKYLINVHISNDTKALIQLLLVNDFDLDLFNGLPNDQQIIVERLVSKLKLNADVQSLNTIELLKSYEILRGEFIAGNDSIDLKKKLKIDILKLKELNLIPTWQFNALTTQLSA